MADGMIGSYATVSAGATVGEDARVAGKAGVYNGVIITDHARVSGRAVISGLGTTIKDNARVFGDATVSNEAVIGGQAAVGGHARVTGPVEICGRAVITGNAWVRDDARVFGNAFLSGNMVVGEGAEVFLHSHVITVDGFFEQPVTVYRTRGGGHKVRAGCQTFQLTDDVQGIATEHEWTLPAEWQHLRDALLKMVADWPSDKPEWWMKYPESWGVEKKTHAESHPTYGNCCDSDAPLHTVDGVDGA